MKKRYLNPFSPDLPIDDPSRFSGRFNEVDSVVDSLYQLAHKTPAHTIITGDRGIGKSSLLLQIRKLAEGNKTLTDKLKIDVGVDKFEFLCFWHDCATDQTPSDLASGILTQIQSKVSKIFKNLNLELNLGGFFKLSEKDNSVKSVGQVVELFCTELTKACKKAEEIRNMGIILFFDEVDRVKANTGVATFFKLSAERLFRDKVKNISFFAAGITGAIQNLEKEHRSISRTFKDVPLPKLEEFAISTCK